MDLKNARSAQESFDEQVIPDNQVLQLTVGLEEGIVLGETLGLTLGVSLGVNVGVTLGVPLVS